MNKNFPFFLMAAILMAGCTSQTFDDLVPITDDDNGPNLVTYVQIEPIIANNCITCHANPPQNGAPMSLEFYLNVKEAVENRGLLDRISRAEGTTGLMPFGGPRLPQGTIDLVFQWNSDGLLEN